MNWMVQLEINTFQVYMENITGQPEISNVFDLTKSLNYGEATV